MDALFSHSFRNRNSEVACDRFEPVVRPTNISIVYVGKDLVLAPPVLVQVRAGSGISEEERPIWTYYTATTRSIDKIFRPRVLTP